MKVFAGLAVVGLGVAGVPGNAFASVVEVKIAVDAGCVASINPSIKVISKKDVLLWSFVSECGDAQDVLVCAKGHPNATHAEPWKEQVGLPKTPPSDTAKLGTRFRIGAGATIKATARALSSVNEPVPSGGIVEPDHYCVYVVNGRVGGLLECPDKKCPPDTPLPPTRGRELALEVDP